MKDNKHYAAICQFYGDTRAERSGVLLIAHIDEGIALLDAIGAPLRAMEAFCIHPLVQDDGALLAALAPESVFRAHQPDAAVVALAMEYRRVANAYLPHHCERADDAIELSGVDEVNQMLIADKVQNRKDFERHHLGRHARSDILQLYFANWLRRLGVSEERYAQLCGRASAAAAAPQGLISAEAAAEPG
ncbi:hypothetical protein RBA41_01030 [Massilia sp. CCM 9210]|uniref:hypothetical protein n=1 Tax=Massilia scottii TaxID=3057166 RepID=UPI0027965376|nr:hypothetical protein [Massilia sp. CCM 9210]MDQ1811877.1 hypothetical protein [Massilia sp. CCM 9210]